MRRVDASGARQSVNDEDGSEMSHRMNRRTSQHLHLGDAGECSVLGQHGPIVIMAGEQVWYHRRKGARTAVTSVSRERFEYAL